MESALDGSLTFRDTDPSHRFSTPQSAFSSNRRERPPPMDMLNEQEQKERVPLTQKNLDRQASKGGLRGMFTRSKTQVEMGIVSPVIEESTPLSPTTESSRNNTPHTLSITKSTTSTSPSTPPTPVTPAAQPTKQSLMNVGGKSIKQKKPATKPSPKSAKSSPRAPARTSASWGPPPLFQAYAQAIKHATLAASTLSADAIIRMNNRKRKNSLHDDIAQTSEERGTEQTAAAKKAEKAKMKHSRQISDSLSKAEWTQKIFVLVTSGYLLQYAGDGTFDRLPEKMLQLGKESVVFASDAIPGKHWVLQISQAMGSDGAPAADSRSLLSRFAFRGADYRRTATSLLLVMDSAEDMDSWLAVVRREIEALGGKKHVSETGKPKPDDKVMKLKAQLSHRYLVHREPEQSSNSSSPSSPTTVAPWGEDPIQWKTEDLPLPSDLYSSQNSNGPISVGNSLKGWNLDHSTDSTHRLSFVSSGQQTLITSQGSSPSISSTRESCSTLDDYPPKISIEDLRMRPNTSAVNERRRSMQTMPISVVEAHHSSTFRPHSTYGVPSRPIRAPSPATPNFSVPSSSSKRFSSSIKSAPHKVLGADTLNIPNTVTTAYDSADVQAKSKQALPEVPTSRRSLLPSSDTMRIQREPAQEDNPNPYASFKGLAPIGTPTANPQGHPSESHSQNHPECRSSLMPTTTLERDTFANFQFPRRSSATLPSIHKNLDTSSRPVPPAFSLPELLMDSSMTPKPSIRSSSNPISLPSERNVPIPELPALSTSSNDKKLRRPISMQMRSSKESKPSHTQLPPLHYSLDLSTPTSGAGHVNTQLQRNSSPLVHQGRQEEMTRTLAARKSMPLLASGPPTAPPPRCALPPLPPPGNGPPSVGWRYSLRVR